MKTKIIENNYKSDLKPVSDIKTIWQRDPMHVIVLLFDKTLRHISYARSALTGWDDERYQTHILNAVYVIERLQMTLSDDKNNSMAANLDDLYRYVIKLLINSLQNKNTPLLAQATTLLMQIRESLSVFVKKKPRLLQH